MKIFENFNFNITLEKSVSYLLLKKMRSLNSKHLISLQIIHTSLPSSTALYHKPRETLLTYLIENNEEKQSSGIAAVEKRQLVTALCARQLAIGLLLLYVAHTFLLVTS